MKKETIRSSEDTRKEQSGSAHASHNTVTAISAGAALVAGVLMSIQARANGELSHALQAASAAAIWSFGSGWVLLTLGLIHPRARAGLVGVYRAVQQRHLKWWEILGGLGGGFFVAVQTYAVPAIGVALFTVSLVGGQTASALLVDRVGLGPAGKRPVTGARVLAAALTFVGVALAATAHASGEQNWSVLPVALTIAAGIGMAVQTAINGQVNRVSGQPMATAWVNFTWGTAFLLGLGAAQLARGTLHVAPNPHPVWWSLIGGVAGVVFIATTAVVVAHLGVLVAMLMTLTGQITTAVVLDLISPTAGAKVNAQLLVGVLITLIAALGAGLSGRRRAPAEA